MRGPEEEAVVSSEEYVSKLKGLTEVGSITPGDRDLSVCVLLVEKNR